MSLRQINEAALRGSDVFFDLSDEATGSVVNVRVERSALDKYGDRYGIENSPDTIIRVALADILVAAIDKYHKVEAKPRQIVIAHGDVRVELLHSTLDVDAHATALTTLGTAPRHRSS